MAFKVNIQYYSNNLNKAILLKGVGVMSKRKMKLKTSTAKECRATLNKLLNLTVNGELDPRINNACVYTVNATLQAIKVHEQEQQIQELQEAIEEIKRGQL